MHEPLLVNSIGHSVGLLLFAGFLALVLQDRRRRRDTQSWLPAIAAALALLWNAGSLVVLATSSDAVAALSFAILSLLPAVLLHLSLEGRVRPIWTTGYALSGIAVGLHLAELAVPDPRFHQAALWVIIAGFGLLTVAAMFVRRRLSIAGRRIPVSMCLFLFAVSFGHFGPGHARYAWSSEIALHHAGIPLALYVLLQDYRFLLLDAFLRLLVNGVVACGFVVLSFTLNSRFQILQRTAGDPFLQGILMVAAGVSLVLLVFVKGKLQLLLTRVVFGRRDREPAITAIREAGSRAESESQFLQSAARVMGQFTGAERAVAGDPDESWVEASVPLRFLKGDGAFVVLGRREGGRRYLSEDLEELARLGAVVVEQVERFRNSEIQRLVSQAELRALQSQINPHFLFNSLNTLYGTIPRQASEARRMVLNLAEIFRYFLQSERSFIPLSEELQIVRAYLQIETLRLGDKLKTEIVVDESAESALIPILSIQPLIENAVKHGVAARSRPGTVRLRARTTSGGVVVEVSDDGGGFRPADSRKSGVGVGLENVRQRLKLSFGDSAHLKVESTDEGSTVSFLIPRARAFPAPAEEVPA